MLSGLVFSLLAAAPLASEDAAVRLAAVQKWAKKQKKPQLSSKEARALTECIELPPVKDTGCTQAAKLCRLHEGDDGSSGTRMESLSLLLTGFERQPLCIWWSATYEVKASECDPPEPMSGSTPSTDERATQVTEWKKTHAKEYARCVARLERKARDDAEELTCDLVLMNVCRKEAYVTCKTRNLRKGVKALEHLHRFDFDPAEKAN